LHWHSLTMWKAEQVKQRQISCQVSQNRSPKVRAVRHACYFGTFCMYACDQVESGEGLLLGKAQWRNKA
jgi:hypothetical protein